MTRLGRQDLLGVQALRAVAAFLVVAYHAVAQWTTHRTGYQPGDLWPNGSAGVDIFFVISGLVMTLSARRNADRANPAWTFAKDRVVRIVPLYWIFTTLKIATIVAMPALAAHTDLRIGYVAGSFALLPVHDAAGIFRPVLPVGWTLTYEMFFYILVAIALRFRLPLHLVSVPVLLVFSALALGTTYDGFPDTIALEFIFGIVIGNAVPRLQSMPPVIGLVVGCIAFVLLVTLPIAQGYGFIRPLAWGLPAAVVVASVVSTEMSLRKILPAWLLEAGNASYATYLAHGFVVPAVFILTRSIDSDWVGLTANVIICLLLSGIAGEIAHRLIEQPLLLRLRTRRPVSTLPAPG